LIDNSLLIFTQEQTTVNWLCTTTAKDEKNEKHEDRKSAYF